MSPQLNHPSRTEEEAAAWFARLNKTSVSTSELWDFRAWRKAPQNDAAYSAIEQIWGQSGGLKSDPDMQAALASALAKPRPRRARTLRRPRQTWLLVTTAATLAATTALVLLTQWGLPWAPVYQTAVGEQRTLILDDGTRVRLDTDTRLSVHFTGAERRIVLARGQALFDVVHAPHRPFLVEAGSTNIRDLGTRFDVERTSGQVKVTLVEGSVTVNTASTGAPRRQWTLHPGQQLATGRAAAPPRSVDTASATSWTTGQLVFHELPLSAATAEINRYSRRKIVLRAPDVGAIPVTGAFDSGDPDAFVSAVSELYGLRAVKTSDGVTTLSQAGPAKTT